MDRVVIVGAGVGGLTTGALLSKAGLQVTVLEAHIYAGGCAGTFYHQGYRFDAGATLAAGFDEGGGMSRLGETLGVTWPVQPAEAAMQVHLSTGDTVTRWTDTTRWQAERTTAFGGGAESFWQWQERTAGALWQAALDGVAWPPQNTRDLGRLAATGLELVGRTLFHTPSLGMDALRPVGAHLPAPGTPQSLRDYVDGQLLIAAQATSERANALYGAAALDMPRRGVAHVRGGIGKIGETLAEAARRHGADVRFRQKVSQVSRRGNGWLVRTEKGLELEADAVIFNLPPWDAARLLGNDASPRMREARPPADGWGAFMVYAGIDAGILPPGSPLHHQVLNGRPFGEGNSVFVSLSLPGDETRAPAGQVAMTMSTHTALRSWWRLLESDRPAYEARKEQYTERVLAAAERALPGLSGALKFVMPGTPVSFERFTHRSLGWVGGFPQTSLFRAWGPDQGRGLWLVGDSIFPGQSILATALGGIRVAGDVLRQAGQYRRREETYESRSRWQRAGR